MKKLFEYYLQKIPHKGKRHIVRLVLKILPFKSLTGHYGPIMMVNKRDKTNIYALCGEYGETIADHIKKFEKGDVFFDVGANYGLFSLLASARVGNDGHVFSFEPNPAVYGYFLSNQYYNDCRNVVSFHCAISDQDKFSGLSFESGHSGKSHLTEQGRFTVPAFNPTKWNFLNEKIAGKNVHIKIDVEGYESKIIQVLMTAPWFSNVKSIIVEVDDQNLKAFGDTARSGIYEPLERLGFHSTINGKSGSHYDEIFVR